MRQILLGYHFSKYVLHKKNLIGINIGFSNSTLDMLNDEHKNTVQIIAAKPDYARISRIL